MLVEYHIKMLTKAEAEFNEKNERRKARTWIINVMERPTQGFHTSEHGIGNTTYEITVWNL